MLTETCYSSLVPVPVFCDGAVAVRAGASAPPEIKGLLPAAVASDDVIFHPADLGDRIGFPVGAEGGHFAARQRLRDAVGAGGRVSRVDTTAGFTIDEVDGGFEIAIGNAGFTRPTGALLALGRN